MDKTQTKIKGAFTHPLRLGLTPMPDRIAQLPVDERGYPIPWFVPFVDGKPEFRAMDGRNLALAMRLKLCWVCGAALGAHLTFVTGPMCLISGTNAEPPSHWACATWSARNCPFLSKPQMVRRENDLPEAMLPGAGLPILRNPGVTAVATMRGYQLFDDGAGRPLIRMGLDTLEHIEWYAEGRKATRAEVQASVDSGFPLLLGAAEQDGPAAVKELYNRLPAFQKLLPAE
jgi:hypothetical protein